MAPLSQLVGNAYLTEGRLLDRQRYDGILDLLRHAVARTKIKLGCGADSRHRRS
jgi:hypothetical protein